MSNTIDQKIVEMKFENSKFEENIQNSIKSLKQLDNTVKEVSHTGGLENLGKAAKNIDLSGMSTAISSIADRFSTMGIIGATVISNLTTSAMGFLSNVYSKISGLIVQGGLNRAMNIEKAKFSLEGLGIAWEKVSEQISFAVNDTAYSLDSAATAASTLAASGVQIGNVARELTAVGKAGKLGTDYIDDMGMALKAISGIAAQTNSDYDSISSIFSTVAGQGKVMTMQLRQLETRGLNAAAVIAKSTGKTEAEIREMITKGGIDFATFSEVMYENFADHATKANDTITGVISNIRSAFAKIGADFLGPIVRNAGPLNTLLESFRQQINGIRKVIGPTLTLAATKINSIIMSLNDALNKMDWSKAFKGFDTYAIENFFKLITRLSITIKSIFKPIKEAFNDVFGEKQTGKSLAYFIWQFTELVNALRAGEKEAQAIKTTFTGIFTVIKILGDLVKWAGVLITNLFKSFSGAKSVSPIGDSFLNLATNITEALVAFEKLLSTGEIFEIISKKIGTALEYLGTLFTKTGLKKLVDDFKESFEGIGSVDTSPFQTLVNNLKNASVDFSGVADILGKALGVIGTIVTGVGKGVVNAAMFVFDGIKTAVEGIINFINKGDFGEAVKNSAMAVMFYNLKKMLIQVRKILFTFSNNGVTTSFKEAMGEIKSALVDNLTEIENNLKANVIIKIALAVGILAAAMYALSAIPSDKMTQSLGAVSVLLGEMVGVLMTLSSLDIKGNLKRASTVMIALAASVYILAKAMKQIAELSFKQIIKSLIGVTGCLGIMVGAAFLLSKFTGNVGMLKTAGLILFAYAVKVLASVVKDLADVGGGDMLKAEIAIAGLAGILAGFSIIMKYASGGLNSIGQGVGLILMSVAIKIMASVVEDLANMEGSIKRGLGALTGLMALMALFEIAMKYASGGLNSIGQGVGLILMSVAIKIMASVVDDLANMEGSLKRGLGALTGLMAIISLFSIIGKISGGGNMLLIGTGLAVMSVGIKILASALEQIAGIDNGLGSAILAIGALLTILTAFSFVAMEVAPGMLALSASMLVFGAALALLIPSLYALSSLTNINTALLNLAKTLGIFLAAGLAAGFVAPGLLTLSVALLTLGAAAFLIGKGLLAIGVGLLSLSTGMSAMAAMKTTVIEGFFAALKAFISGLGTLIPDVMKVILDAIVQLCLTFQKALPIINATIIMILDTALSTLARYIPKLLQLLGVIIENLCSFILEYAPKIYDTILSLVDGLLNVLLEHIPGFIEVGTEIIIALMEGLSNASQKLTDKAFELMTSFIEGLATTIETRTPELIEAVNHLFKALIDAALLILTGGDADFLNKAKELMGNLKKGFENKKFEIVNSVGTIINSAVSKIKEKYSAFRESGQYIIQGLKDGIDAAKQAVFDKIANIGDTIKDKFNFSVSINSPSKDFYESGMFIMLGLRNGITAFADKAIKAVTDVGEDVIDESKSIFETISDVLTDDMDLNPVIKPTLDLSEITNGARQVNSMFNNSSLGVDGTNQNGVLGAGTTVNFTQNNYSPKSLSRVEIYRQTRNQLSMLGGA